MYTSTHTESGLPGRCGSSQPGGLLVGYMRGQTELTALLPRWGTLMFFMTKDSGGQELCRARLMTFWDVNPLGTQDTFSQSFLLQR